MHYPFWLRDFEKLSCIEETESRCPWGFALVELSGRMLDIQRFFLESVFGVFCLCFFFPPALGQPLPVIVFVFFFFYSSSHFFFSSPEPHSAVFQSDVASIPQLSKLYSVPCLVSCLWQHVRSTNSHLLTSLLSGRGTQKWVSLHPSHACSSRQSGWWGNLWMHLYSNPRGGKPGC